MQSFIAAIAASDLDGVDTIGRSEDDDKKDAWALRYIARMIEAGVPAKFAIENYSAGDHDYSTDPEYAADSEMSYWDDDGT